MITWERIEADKEVQGAIWTMFGLLPEDIKLAYISKENRERVQKLEDEVQMLKLKTEMMLDTITELQSSK